MKEGWSKHGDSIARDVRCLLLWCLVGNVSGLDVSPAWGCHVAVGTF